MIQNAASQVSCHLGCVASRLTFSILLISTLLFLSKPPTIILKSVRSSVLIGQESCSLLRVYEETGKEMEGSRQVIRQLIG